MATKVMVVNKPIKATIKYVNVWPNDVSKNDGKGYGASLALKGTIDGVPDTTVYPKGFLNRNIDALVKAGVIEDGHYQHDPAEKYSIPVKDGEVTMELRQGEKERYPTFTITTANGHTPEPQYESPTRLPGEEPEEPRTNGRPVVADALTKNGNTKWEEMKRKYAECIAAADEIVGPVMDSSEPTNSAIVAAAATLYIQRMQAHV